MSPAEARMEELLRERVAHSPNSVVRVGDVVRVLPTCSVSVWRGAIGIVTETPTTHLGGTSSENMLYSVTVLFCWYEGAGWRRSETQWLLVDDYQILGHVDEWEGQT